MDLNSVKFSEESNQAALKLRLKVELHLGKKIKKVDTIESLLTLLRYSQKSTSAEIKAAYSQFTRSLTSDQVSFFNTLGLNTQAAPGTSEETAKDENSKPSSTYRGAHLLNKNNSQNSADTSDADKQNSEADKQRKKKMYRGREVI